MEVFIRPSYESILHNMPKKARAKAPTGTAPNLEKGGVLSKQRIVFGLRGGSGRYEKQAGKRKLGKIGGGDGMGKQEGVKMSYGGW